MKCIVGLGNPGKKYSKTRHNVGFMVVEKIADRHNWKLKKDKFNGKSTVETLDGEKIVLLKPQTFMNLSGESVRPLLDFYQIDPEDVLVIYDDLDLPAGKIRLRQKGGHGGHNGIRSIIDHAGTKEFKRLRIGIGRPLAAMPVVDYVLKPFSKEQQEDVATSIEKSADACETWIQKPFDVVMNDFNT
ncbi:aminoacyl-tRNA hydrolase [Lentibacillus amyloliquefaciens]|uniref:Peptidyl-tRNA hydrolase n=1 Tax=Lentibacillus amyloliquefaciens TaxID=1472767 RepID=A0A0U3W8I2_9BACI|nr:aminoacyl-tRNA hydrolase [Lentibacillus amyloliquefaciens]ALX49440.1 peptidyl-tRNA hydrolase [Lentibacillus amyloliquefaciens]